jgi:GAF domain
MVEAAPLINVEEVVPGDDSGQRLREERKRYTTQLQRKAQAHVTAELGAPSAEEDTDRQVTMLVRHALETTGARRVTLLRPVPRGRRWHVATGLDDGCFYYGLVAPESLVLSRAACERKVPVMLGGNEPVDQSLPQVAELGIKSYLGVPVVAGGRAVAVVEAIDVSRPEEFEFHTSTLEKAVAALADRLATENQGDTWRASDSGSSQITETTLLDLVLRPEAGEDEAMEITAAEWAVVHLIDGQRKLGAIAQEAGLQLPQVVSLVEKLLGRGLIRIGLENRRRL